MNSGDGGGARPAVVAVSREGMAIDRREGVDWDALREEYLAGGIGMKALAAKWGISRYAVEQRARAEDWVALRDARAVEPKDSDVEIARRTRRQMLKRLERMAEAMPTDAVTERKTQEDSTVSLFKLRDLTAAYKELTGDLPLGDDAPETVRVVVDP